MHTYREYLSNIYLYFSYACPMYDVYLCLFLTCVPAKIITLKPKLKLKLILLFRWME